MDLYLYKNNIGDDGARSLAAMLAKNITLEALHVGGNDMGLDGERAIFSVLEASNFTLCECDGVGDVEHLLSRNKLIEGGG